MRSRSPIREAPLRRAGQFLEEAHERILDRLDQVLFQAGGIVLVLVFEWIHWWRPKWFNVRTLLALSAISAFFILYCIARIILLRRNLRSLKKGLEGERYMGQQLESLRKLGFEVLHDLKLDGLDLNVDHILIGHKGIYAVETKAVWKEPSFRGATITTDGKTVRIAGTPSKGNPIGQVRLVL
jgi:hypothetical protein